MLRNLCLAGLSLLLPAFGISQHAFLDQALTDRLQTATETELIPVLASLEDAVNMANFKAEMITEGVPVNRRAQAVMAALKSKASSTQGPVVAYLLESGLPYQDLRQFWISNCIAFSANKALIEALSNRSEVAYIALDEPGFGLVVPEKAHATSPKSEGGIEPGLAAVGAPEMWAMGYTGNGRLALTFDTGIWHDHPAFATRFLANLMPLSQTWFAYDSPFPIDKSSSHGTHVTGTMIGLDPNTADTIGVAPRAYVIATDPVVSNLAFVKPLSDFMFGFEWSLNPDGNDETSTDIPDVINNSWGFWEGLGEPPCPEFAVPVFEAVEAAGIANVFSAGNSGPDPVSISTPQNLSTGLVNCFTVGAINGNNAGPNYPIANFSSRGPTQCGGEGSLLIKPEVVAPGVNVRSSVENGEYDVFSGTSMASPHVSGVVLLLKEAFPYLSGEEILLAIYFSASDLGVAGEDNTFGMGMINALDAFNYLAATYDPVPPNSPDVDLELLSLSVGAENYRCSQPSNDAVTPIATVRNNGADVAQALTINYAINGGNQLSYTAPTFSLAPGESTDIMMPVISSSAQVNNELHGFIALLDNEYDPFNNHAVKRWEQLKNVDDGAIAFEEDFSLGFEKWTVINPDYQTTWDTTVVIQKNGEFGHAAFLQMYGYSPIANQKDELLGPVLWNAPAGLQLRFDYFYRKVSSSTTTQDTLRVYALSNCGTVKHELWKRGGSQLWTVPVNFANAFPQNAEDWMEITLDLDLSELTGADPDGGIGIIFESTNRGGNNLFIDNVQMSSTLGIHHTAPSPSAQLSPNPAQNVVNVSWSGNDQQATAEFYDLSGRRVMQHNRVRKNVAIDISALSQGLYIVTLSFDNGSNASAKLAVN
jgi:bacillopeptidase F